MSSYRSIKIPKSTNLIIKCEIWGSHSADCEDYHLTIFWDVMPCSLLNVYCSEQHAASIFRAKYGKIMALKGLNYILVLFTLISLLRAPNPALPLSLYLYNIFPHSAYSCTIIFTLLTMFETFILVLICLTWSAIFAVGNNCISIQSHDHTLVNCHFSFTISFFILSYFGETCHF
jgi:hypothetical protein